MMKLTVLAGTYWLCAVAGTASAQSTTAPKKSDLEMSDAEVLSLVVSQMRAMPDELAPFNEEDRRRVELLRSYTPGETTYLSVCDAWDFVSGAHLGFLGFSKTDNVVRIHMGRDLETLVSELTYGYESNTWFARSVLLGNCRDKIGQPYDSAFESDRSIQCVLSFEGETLTDNGCTNLDVLLPE